MVGWPIELADNTALRMLLRQHTICCTVTQEFICLGAAAGYKPQDSQFELQLHAIIDTQQAI